ncbi:hypothetical protein NVV95_06525 [Herbiconiux sp. CPCC 205716]|uniref:MmyB-like transcription regulator ligand binding domain-containing protein n=1 Tax=Herbiconiux gentiana TaxID=2970912 RepID=A0ABT2GD99_9MICO|nr:hypothetical protein [Herbiconiux gentiana]MCS5714206.1 hypothetical protein [Herbiconiux gentiana]
MEKVPKGLLALLSTINSPAFVMNKYRDILAVSPLASLLEPALKVGANRLVSLFTDPIAREYHPDWEANTASVVAQLRIDIGADECDPDYQHLVRELAADSDRFRELWARFDVQLGGSAASIIRNPAVGDVELLREKLVAEPNDLILVIYHAVRGSDSEQKLAKLRSLGEMETKALGAELHPVAQLPDCGGCSSPSSVEVEPEA